MTQPIIQAQNIHKTFRSGEIQVLVSTTVIEVERIAGGGDGVGKNGAEP